MTASEKEYFTKKIRYSNKLCFTIGKPAEDALCNITVVGDII